MTGPTPPESYDPTLKTIHWTTAAIILAQLLTGWIMTGMNGPGAKELYALHKALGVLVLFVTFLRLPWRLSREQPGLPGSLRPWEKSVAILTQRLLYVLLIVQPLTGWAIYSLSPYKASFFGLFPIPDLPFMDDLAGNAAAKELLEGAHGAGAALFAALIVLHAAAALKHHFVMRDDVLLRMAPKALAPSLMKMRGRR